VWLRNPRRGVARWRLSQIICSIIELASYRIFKIYSVNKI